MPGGRGEAAEPFDRVEHRKPVSYNTHDVRDVMTDKEFEDAQRQIAKFGNTSRSATDFPDDFMPF